MKKIFGLILSLAMFTPVFASAAVTAIQVGAQSVPFTYSSSTSVTYTVNFPRTGNNPSISGLTVTGLPAGATYTPNPIPTQSASGNHDIAAFTLTVTPATSSPAGTSVLTITSTSPSLTATTSLTIAKANQAITSFPTISNKNYGDADFNVSATASSKLPVEFSTSNTNVCTVSGTTVHITGAGICGVIAAQPGNANYNAAVTVFRSFTVSKKALTITAASSTKVYGETKTYDGTEFTTSGLVSGDSVSSVTLSSAGDAASSQVSGSPYTITASAATGTGVSSYAITYQTGSLTVTKRPLILTFAVNDKEYDGTTAATLSTTNFGDVVSGDDVSLDGATAAFDSPNAGAGKTVTITNVSLSGGSLGNYQYTIGASTTTANITPADQTVTLSFVPPVGVVYGDADIDIAGLATSTSGIPPLFSAGGACTVVGGHILHYIRGSVNCTVVAYVRNDNFISGVATNNYLNREAKVSFAVARASQTISSTFAAPKNATFGDADIDLSNVATSTSGLPLTFVTGGGACVIADGTKLHFIRGGVSCVLSIRQGGSLQYLPATKIDVSFPVARKAQKIIFGLTNVSESLAASPVTLTATSDSGLPVSYYISTPTICSASGDQLSLLATGTCKIYARQTGDLRYLPAVQVYGALLVTR